MYNSLLIRRLLKFECGIDFVSKYVKHVHQSAGRHPHQCWFYPCKSLQSVLAMHDIGGQKRFFTVSQATSQQLNIDCSLMLAS